MPKGIPTHSVFEEACTLSDFVWSCEKLPFNLSIKWVGSHQRDIEHDEEWWVDITPLYDDHCESTLELFSRFEVCADDHPCEDDYRVEIELSLISVEPMHNDDNWGSTSACRCCGRLLY